MSEPTSEHIGTIVTRFWTIIPFLLIYSISDIGPQEQIRVDGRVHALHITPFFAIGFVKRLNKF